MGGRWLAAQGEKPLRIQGFGLKRLEIDRAPGKNCTAGPAPAVLRVARWRFELEPIRLAKAHTHFRSCILCRREVRKGRSQTTLS